MGKHPIMDCIVCGDPQVVARRRCHTCYQYRRKHGVDRPEELIIRLTARDVERELTARVIRRHA